MKHFPVPATRRPASIAGVERTRAPYAYGRTTAALVCAIFYAAGLFTGAILFGEALLRLHTS